MCGIAGIVTKRENKKEKKAIMKDLRKIEKELAYIINKDPILTKL